jgi:hypothetical protein
VPARPARLLDRLFEAAQPFGWDGSVLEVGLLQAVNLGSANAIRAASAISRNVRWTTSLRLMQERVGDHLAEILRPGIHVQLWQLRPHDPRRPAGDRSGEGGAS